VVGLVFSGVGGLDFFVGLGPGFAFGEGLEGAWTSAGSTVFGFGRLTV
jgi:hypothetical protein